MRKGIALIILSVLGFIACSESMDKEDESNRLKAPDFTLFELSGTAYQLSDLKGKVVVLYFFTSTDCLSCLEARPDIEADLVKPFEGKEVVMLALDVANGSRAEVKYFKDFTGVLFPVLMNASEVAQDYKITYDRLMVIGKNGMIRFRGSGPVINETTFAKEAIIQQLN